MPTIKTKREMSEEAVLLAESFSLVMHDNVLYLPVDYKSGYEEVNVDPLRTIWLPLSPQGVQRRALQQFDTLFQSSMEELNFHYMVCQSARQFTGDVSGLLVRTPDGLKELRGDGQLHEPNGEFVPNCLPVMLNSDEADKAEVMSVLTEWLGSEEEAVALLRHLATALAPDWSAVKYVLLLGDGRNGKSVLMSMVQRLFGWENCSHVTRQEISKASPVVTEVQGKLVNIIYDGMAEYLRDSGNEKSLIAGEPVSIRKLYSSQTTMVKTNALFIEGLNKEPKSSDKSTALQARIIRFWFPNVYKDNLMFMDHMLSDRMVGALLALMIDNFVRKEHKAVMLAPTSTSVSLQLEHMHANSLAIQFLTHIEDKDPLGADGLIGLNFSEVATRFQSWRINEGDLNPWSEPDIFELFRPVVLVDRKSKRVNNKPRKVKVLTGFKPDAIAFLESLKGDDVAHGTAMVENDGAVPELLADAE